MFPNIQQFTRGIGVKKVSPIVIYFGILYYNNCK